MPPLPEVYTNSAVTTLQLSMLAGDTTCTIADPTNFPSTNGQYRIIINNEIMLVTAVAGSVLTVTRAQEGTTAVAHSAGATVAGIATAASIVRARDRHPWLHNREPGKLKVVNGTVQTITKGTEYTMLNIGAGNSGYITNMFITPTNSDFIGRERNLLKIYLDQEVSPSYSGTLVNTHAADYAPDNNKFFTRYIGFGYTNASPFTTMYYNWFPIPF